HLALANELAPNSPAILVTQGNYYFMRGDRDKAIATWNTLVAKRSAGLLQYNSYFDALASHNLVEQALPTVGRFLSRAVTKLSWDELSPFVRKVALAGKNNNNLSKAIADALYQVIRDNPNNIKLGQMLVQEDLVTTTEAKTTVYRAMLERYQDLLVAVTATGGSYRDGEYYSSDKVGSLLDGHERKLIDFLIADRQFDQVRQNLRYMQDSHSELGVEITPEWMEMAQAVVELRTGTGAGAVDNAVAALRRYVGVAEKKSEDYVNVEEDRHLKAYTLLVNEHQPQAADQLLYEYYQKQLRIGQGTIANYTGIAGVEFRRGHSKEALSWLQKMIAILGNADAAIEAGKLAERYELHKEAFDWRSQGARLNPAQVENRLELARNAALIGQNQLGVNTLKQLIENRETNNIIRAQAVALIPSVAGKEANTFLATFQNNPDYYAQLVTSGLLIAVDRKAEARLILQQASKSTTAAQARLMLAALETTTGAAKTALQDALYSDAKTMISQAIAFDIDEPNAVLVQAFISNNQFNAALAFSPIKTKRMLAPEEEGEYYDSENASDSTQNTNFRSFNYQEIDVTARQSKYLTLAEMAAERRKATANKLLESLIDVAIKVGDLPQAISLITDYQNLINSPQQFALLEGKRKALVLQVNNIQAVEEATLKLGTGFTQSVLDQLLSKSVGNEALEISKEGEGL
ncbi:MAG: hypothetical protein FD167_1932, partial [bacterium]